MARPERRRSAPAEPALVGLALAGLLSLAGCEATIVEPTLPPAWTEIDAARPLTHADCVRLACESAPNAAAWESRRLAARARLDQAGLLSNPTLALGWEDFGLDESGSGSPVQTTLSLAIDLADVAARGRRESAARYELEAEQAELKAEAARLSVRVTHAYDELVTDRARVAQQDFFVATAVQQESDVQQLVESGEVPRIELERSELDTLQTRADLEQLRTAARARELEFAFALGFERPVALQLGEGLSGTGAGTGPDTDTDLAELLADAAAHRPELAAAEARYQAELERLHLATERVQFLPTVGAGPRTQDGELLGVASIEVALPLFDSGATAERGQQAALLAAAAALRGAAQDVAGQVCAAAERLVAAESRRAGPARDLAERRTALRERTERLFHAGEAGYFELAQARRDEIEAGVGMLEAEASAAAARVELSAALGRSPAP